MKYRSLIVFPVVSSEAAESVALSLLPPDAVLHGGAAFRQEFNADGTDVPATHRGGVAVFGPETLAALPDLAASVDGAVYSEPVPTTGTWSVSSQLAWLLNWQGLRLRQPAGPPLPEPEA